MDDSKKLQLLMASAVALSVILVAVIFLEVPGFPLPTFFIDQPASQDESWILSDQVETSQVINLNTATMAQLDTLPGVGEVTARRIIEYRESIGGFTSVYQLTDVERIGEKTLEKLLPYVTVS